VELDATVTGVSDRAEGLPPHEGRTGEIRPLTGIRIVAALWVVFFHIRGNLYLEFPGVGRFLSPILNHGDLGVDLFFALSGFVLTLNYLDRLGDRLSRRDTARFLWARLARVWPVYFVTLNLAALWHGALLLRGGPDPVAPSDFSALSYLRQLTMVVMWTEPDSDRLTWDGPAWSISCEWLAYLVFPLIAMLLLRLAWVLRARHLVLLGAIAMFPAILLAVVSGSLYWPYLWLPRLLGSFVAGGIACLVARRVIRTRRTDSIAGWAAIGLAVAMIAILYGARVVHQERLSVVATVLFAPFLVALAVSGRGLSRVLSSRPFVLGGYISYSVYLVHMLLVEPVWWAQNVWPQAITPHTLTAKLVFLALPALACLAGYAMWRWVEEPARKTMRAMSSMPGRPAGRPSNGARQVPLPAKAGGPVS
jgi:peptidoglycan/LPS O-acetylase OafA/YrhL